MQNKNKAKSYPFLAICSTIVVLATIILLLSRPKIEHGDLQDSNDDKYFSIFREPNKILSKRDTTVSLHNLADTFELTKFLDPSTGKTSIIKTFLFKDRYAITRNSFKIWHTDGLVHFTRPVSFSSNKFIPFNEHFFSKAPTISEFAGCQFDSIVIFVNNVYDTALHFFGNTFNDNVFIINKYEAGDAPLFSYTTFKRNIKFSKVGTHITTGSEFKNDLIFKNCSISGVLRLSHCIFENDSKFILQKTSLPDMIDLSGSVISGLVDLTSALPNTKQKCELNLWGSSISRIKLEYQYFNLYFPDSVLKNKIYYDHINSIYVLLLNNFKTFGYDDSYKRLDKEYKLWQSRNNFLMKIDYAWWQFGYEKWMILLWTGGFLFWFSIWNFFSYRILQHTYSIDKLDWRSIGYNRSPWTMISKKFFLTLLYTSIIFFRIGIDYKNLNFISYWSVVYIIFQYAIGLICTGFLINWIIS